MILNKNLKAIMAYHRKQIKDAENAINEFFSDLWLFVKLIAWSCLCVLGFLIIMALLRAL